MKKRVLGLAIALGLVVSAVGFTACGDKAGDDKTIKVGASPSPHAEILKAAKDELEKEGYKLEIVEFQDYVQPNIALDEGEIDANYFQHKPYLDEFNKEKGTKITSIAGIHYEPLGIYKGSAKTLDAIPVGAKVAVPNDPSNEARALLLLQDNGLIKLKDGAGLTATKQDIVSNPKKLEILELEAAAIPKGLSDTAVSVINGNYALGAKLTSADAIAYEKADSEAAQKYVNILVVKEGKEDTAKIKALKKALQSDAIKKFIEDTYKGAVLPLFN
ncbi:MAG: MetQ/NlpA family ABC transporter substrate-binding protein [Eubacteriales bacterium]|nr:MetQ/NlpA family ABC transporter substrate-binding protein [Eubacteriales bacterium]MDY3332527.1 MetQ/NlpA family ABC transporter substrate-binding protein [Gallibacter sp.]